jgi:hypothetical protein
MEQSFQKGLVIAIRMRLSAGFPLAVQAEVVF